MDDAGIEDAYRTFAQTLRAGGFLQPDTGWDASLIAARIAANNEAIASVAEDTAAGLPRPYDIRGNATFHLQLQLGQLQRLLP